MLATMFDEERLAHQHAMRTWRMSEPKLDGIRLVVDLLHGHAWTRVVGVEGGQANKWYHIPWLAQFKGLPIILDGEIVAGKNSRDTMSVLGSRAGLAIEKQREMPLTFHAFDVLWDFNGHRVIYPRYERRKWLEDLSVNDFWLVPHFQLVPVSMGPMTNEQYFNHRVAMGDEGIMLKDPMGQYEYDTRPPDNWIKVKPKRTFIAVVTGIRYGKGKFQGLVGALELGMWDGSRLVPVGSAGTGKALNNETRQLSNWRVHEVVEVSCYEITDEMKLWHPRVERKLPGLSLRETNFGCLTSS